MYHANYDVHRLFGWRKEVGGFNLCKCVPKCQSYFYAALSRDGVRLRAYRVVVSLTTELLL